jgi:hypothetical protein
MERRTKLEGTNASSNNMDKDDDQIIHKEQVFSDHEHNEDKLLSKQSRSLPTTRHDDFLWLDIDMNH